MARKQWPFSRNATTTGATSAKSSGRKFPARYLPRTSLAHHLSNRPNVHSDAPCGTLARFGSPLRSAYGVWKLDNNVPLSASYASQICRAATKAVDRNHRTRSAAQSMSFFGVGEHLPSGLDPLRVPENVV